MKTLLVTSLVVFLVMAYATVGGAVGMRFYRWRQTKCPTCNDHGSYRTRCYEMHTEPACFAGALWPFLLPIMVGVWSATRDPRADRLQAEIDRLERELGIGERR